MIAIIAPTAAPLDTPIKPGSIRGFLNNPCNIAPDKPNPPPTRKAKINRGILIFQITISCILVVEESKLKKLGNKVSKICLTEILTGPFLIYTSKSKNRTMKRLTKNKVIFLLLFFKIYFIY